MMHIHRAAAEVRGRYSVTRTSNWPIRRAAGAGDLHELLIVKIYVHRLFIKDRTARHIECARPYVNTAVAARIVYHADLTGAAQCENACGCRRRDSVADDYVAAGSPR